jgi:FixJ family two-component response regulator
MILYVVDEDSGVRRQLHARLGCCGIRVWPFAHADDFLDQVDALCAAPIVADLSMEASGGSALLESLAGRDISWPAIMTTEGGDIATAVTAMRMGAIEVLEKPMEADALQAALDRAFAQLSTSAITTARTQAARQRIALLTARERSVVQLLIAGNTNKAIGETLAISPRTVEGHRARALRKLEVRSIAEMVYLAADGGIDLRAIDPAVRD